MDDIYIPRKLDAGRRYKIAKVDCFFLFASTHKAVFFGNAELGIFEWAGIGWRATEDLRLGYGDTADGSSADEFCVGMTQV